MSPDVRTLLHDTAEVPSRSPDIDGAMRVARERRRRHRGVGAVVGVVVLALVGGVFVATSDGGGEARVAIGPRQTESSIPDGWTQVHADPGITIAVPPGWNQYDFGNTDVAETRVALGTTEPPDNGVLTACASATPAPRAAPPYAAPGGVPTQPGTWLSVWEYPDPTVSEIQTPEGNVAAGFPDRPENLGAAVRVAASCERVGNAATGDLSASFGMLPFRDAGRLFYVRVIQAYPVGRSADFTTAAQVLDTLRVEPLTPATTAAPVVTAPTTTPPLPTVTTVPAFVASTDDERAIQELVERWLGGEHTEESQRAAIEDADSILEALRQGLAQYPDRLPFYTGSLDALTFEGVDRASIRFTLYYKGQPAYTRDGEVVRLDGQWKVTRETECAFLALGGIKCPPKAS